MDITFKGIPDEIGEQKAREWMGVLVERYHTSKVNQIPEVMVATETARIGIDTFRTANALAPKFAKVEEAKPVEEKIEG